MQEEFDLVEFEWDNGNKHKSLQKHGVTNEEAEDGFLDPAGKTRKTRDDRYLRLGVSTSGRHLFQVF